MKSVCQSLVSPCHRFLRSVASTATLSGRSLYLICFYHDFQMILNRLKEVSAASHAASADLSLFQGWGWGAGLTIFISFLLLKHMKQAMKETKKKKK